MEAEGIFEVGRNNYCKGPMLGACLKYSRRPARKPLGWNGGRGKASGYYVRDICTLEVGVGQIMQDSLGMVRSLVFTLNLMEPLWGFEPG